MGGCGTSGKSNEDLSEELDKYDVVHSKAEMQDGDFIYRLVSEQEEYADGQSVTLYAELEYIGEQSEVTIEHAASPFYFPMEEKIRGFEIPYPMPEPLVMTTLKKGEALRVSYTGSGAYSEDDEKAYVEFMKDFIKNGFPTGYYTVDGFADFWVQKNDHKNEPDRYHIEAQVDFKVK
ncbi:hypothetical protein F4V44_16455 [Niallia endozanthoxylica]|uniref:Uncharacterized protein n=1 Tax=Niallia endozanthoxylica TaxID=2036016 RepID=A0A5J5HM33_9BACI|nr:hypothetical protein F4V44_16455 [Niallia endozanthoxylica]